jgi:hypothetical protein
VLLDVGNNDILDSGVSSIGGVAMGLWGKLVFLGGRGGVVSAALVGFVVVLVASSSSALAPSSKASSSLVVRGSSSVIAVAAHDLTVAVFQLVSGFSSSFAISIFRNPAIRPSAVVVCRFVDLNR